MQNSENINNLLTPGHFPDRINNFSRNAWYKVAAMTDKKCSCGCIVREGEPYYIKGPKDNPITMCSPQCMSMHILPVNE